LTVFFIEAHNLSTIALVFFNGTSAALIYFTIFAKALTPSLPKALNELAILGKLVLASFKPLFNLDKSSLPVSMFIASFKIVENFPTSRAASLTSWLISYVKDVAIFFVDNEFNSLTKPYISFFAYEVLALKNKVTTLLFAPI
jgi:hypothetical protein